MTNNSHDIIDHIVYCVSDLDAGVRKFEALTGVRPSHGGKHLQKGTHNALVKIGINTYFEIIAPDPENHKIASNRWMGIDLAHLPRITRWAIKTSNLESQAKILASFESNLGAIQEGSRLLNSGDILSWKLTDPLSQPAVSVVPFLLDWKNSIHPTDNLQIHCKLSGIHFFDPKADQLTHLFEDLNLNFEIFQGTESRINMTLETPNGKIEIS